MHDPRAIFSHSDKRGETARPVPDGICEPNASSAAAYCLTSTFVHAFARYILWGV